MADEENPIAEVAVPPGPAEPLDQQPKTPRSPRRRASPARDKIVVTDPDTAKGAGAAGVGGGTLIAIVAAALPDGILKSVLIWAAPTATLTFSALWIWARRKIVDHYENKDAEREFQAARLAIEAALNNPSLTPDQKAAFEEKRFELDQMIVSKRMATATRHARTS